MEAKWHFNEHRSTDTANDPANDAFFTADKLENVSEALVREGIQNSLDAAVRGAGGERNVRIRIRLVSEPSPAAVRFLSESFSEDEEHFRLGANTRFSEKSGSHGYLVFEDFGTTGLGGDIAAYRLADGKGNAFWSFFRAMGISGKGDDSIGRWGIGKQVFPATSRLRAIFGLTVRSEEPCRVLMGAAVLRSRTIGDVDYDPHARFGIAPRHEREPVMPVETAKALDGFASAFDLKREAERGLSIVIPYIDERVDESDLRRGIVRNFFWPILLGELEVDIEAKGKSWRLDAEQLNRNLELLSPAEGAVVKLAEWAAFVKSDHIIKLPNDESMRPQWNVVGDRLFTPEALKEIRERLLTDQKVAIEIPVRVRPKEGTEAISSFRIYYEPSHDAGYPTVFLRDGIVISDVRRAPAGASRSLVVIDKGPLAGLLGDSEGVNHTQWQKDSPKFHGRYTYGAETITFVSRSIGEFLKRLHPTENDSDPTLLLDLFFVPNDHAQIEKIKKPEKEGGGEKSGEGGGSQSQPRPFVLRRVESGFVLKPSNTPITEFPFTVQIEAGYARRRGDAIKGWAPDDFQFCRAPLRYEPKPKGVSFQEQGNMLLVELKQADFEFGVVGFDKRRDLVVRAVEGKS